MTIFSSTTSLPPGSYKYRLVLRNPQTGRAARGESSFEVREPAPTGLVAFPPLLVVPGTGAHFVQGGGKARPAGSPGDVSLKSLYPLIPKDGVPVTCAIPKKTPIVWAVVRCAAPANPPAPSLKADFLIVKAGAKEGIPLDHHLWKGKTEGELGIFLFAIDWTGLSPGEYILAVVLTDERTGVRTAAERAVRIVSASRGSWPA
jgi:hypothetical protein